MKRFALLFLAISALISNTALADTPPQLDALGPGNKIAGIDISKWQHPFNKPIDFLKMHSAGIRFVIIKGADSQDPADSVAFKYVKQDRALAQSLGMYTGFYYYAYLPDTTDAKKIVIDARAQAQKAIWRLSSLGGYNSLDLPIALDLENNCVRVSGGVCQKYMNKKYVTLWAQTWLDMVAAKSDRKPFVYSYPQFLQTAMVRAASLAQYPLWIAAYGKSPAISSNQPGVRSVGCFAHSWTKSNCTTNYQIWQYTSCGIGAKYGVPTARVDLNVFNGDANGFLSLAKGIWQPEPFDALPVNEPTTINIVSTTVSDTNGTTSIVVDVTRPDGTPVVTGTVNFTSLDSLLPNGKQDPVRSATGRWTLKISGLSAANYLGLINFVDDSGTHAPSSAPLQFTIAQGATLPTPKPTVKPTKKPAPVDSCAGQVRN